MSNTRLRGNLTPSGRLHGSIRAGISYGTFDYEELHNKPKINNQTLDGNKTASELGLVAPSDLAPVATSGDYNDLENKPTIPVAQVNADWNANSGKAKILNKPAIPTKVSELQNDSGFVPSSSLAPVATSGDYDDLSNKPTIPAAQVNADWDATEGVAQILNKPTIPAKVSDLQNDSDFVPSGDLSEVAFSGDYDDLHNKPSVASYATELSISDTDPTNTKKYIDDKTDKNILYNQNGIYITSVGHTYLAVFASAKISDVYSVLDNYDPAGIFLNIVWNSDTGRANVVRISSGVVTVLDTNPWSAIPNTDTTKIQGSLAWND